MELRSFRASDLGTLSEIDQACFPAGIAYTQQELASFICQPNSRTWVAVGGGDIVGFLVAIRRSNRVAHIITIDVVESWRRRGVGRRLMDAAEDWAARLGLQSIHLETSEENTTAQQFYEARGYAKVRKVDHYYGNGATAWVMVKKLKSDSGVENRKFKVRTPEA